MSRCDCLVVGGGVAGLYAAHLFLKRNPSASVTVVEGRSRLGGRLYGVPFGNDGAVEKPRSLIWVATGGGAPRFTDRLVRALAVELNLPLSFRPPPTLRGVAQGGRWSKDLADSVLKPALQKVVKCFKNRRGTLPSGLTFAQFLDRCLTSGEKEELLRWWGFEDMAEEDYEAVVETYGLSDVAGDTFYGKFGSEKGYQALVDALVRSLRRQNVRFLCGVRAQSVRPCPRSLLLGVQTVADGTETEWKAPAVFWCTDGPGLSRARFETEEERLGLLVRSSFAVPFLRLYVRYADPVAALSALPDGLLRTDGALGNVAVVDRERGVALMAYVSGSRWPSYWAGLADNPTDGEPIHLTPRQPAFARVARALEEAARKTFGQRDREGAEGRALSGAKEILLVFWKAGVHAWTATPPSSSPEELLGGRMSADRSYRIRHRTFYDGRLRVAGEAFASGHGWVENALESVQELF